MLPLSGEAERRECRHRGLVTATDEHLSEQLPQPLEISGFLPPFSGLKAHLSCGSTLLLTYKSFSAYNLWLVGYAKHGL
jgi:hypothetical protein